MNDPIHLLHSLRTAAAEAFARERLAALGDAEGSRQLATAWQRADAAARVILDAVPSPGHDLARARYEALLWLEGGVAGALADAPLPGAVPGSLESVSVVGLVATVDSIEGLAEITRVALACAESTGRTAKALATKDPDASHVLGLVAALAHALAASAAERLDAIEPKSRESALQRAAALVAQTLAGSDEHAVERAGMIAMRAGLELNNLKL